MNNQLNLSKQIREFRDKLKEYQEICIKIYDLRHEYTIDDVLNKKESETREILNEDYGRLDGWFKKLNVPMATIVPSIGIPTAIFEEALSADFDNPYKFDSLTSAIQSSSQAIGLSEVLTDTEYNKLSNRIPVVFLSHSFAKKDENIINKINSLLSSFPISIIVGSRPTSGSVSEKIKKMIDDSDVVIAILTKSYKDSEDNWLASKWIYDEIAYSLGKDKLIIRLLENDVKYQEAISGDSEYIKFNRNNLTELFLELTKILNGILSE